MFVTKSRFKTSNNDHVIQVNMYDELDFVCPTFEEWEDSSQFEYYIIYQVSKKEYDDCYIYPETKAIMIVNCSSPNQRKRFTILFEPFASIPHVPEFKKGGTYYYISTSTGQRDGIANVQQGACLYRNMKLTITVCCVSTTTTAPTAARVSSTTTTTATPVRPSDRPSTSRPLYNTTGYSTKFTDQGIDKTSHKPLDKDKGPKDENSINKDSEDELNNPKQQGLVNSSRTLTPSRALSVVLSILSLLSWLRR
ncbi:hypothetical protein LSH36_231g04017 [Paralvinella palmiformis]|uniref:Ephrin RBD domain-containing protein n=1 Tax=Paralvinella palmiformis TaxID=53620 RepID=A0AAD9N6C5_9ANNE|nr:hypothetical protein LSH36_231g04017 [Paralvinella palmiformis]